MIYSIYKFIDNRNRPYYVGQTNNIVRRQREHKEAILHGNQLPKYKKARRLMNNGIAFKMVTIRKTNTRKKARKLEKHFIKKYRKDGYKLTNCI